MRTPSGSEHIGTSPPSRLNGWGQGEPECFLGRRRAFDAAAVSGAGQTLRARHSPHPRPSLTPPLSSPYGCLVGRPANRIQVGTRHSETEEAEERTSATEGFLCCQPSGLMVVGRSLRMFSGSRTRLETHAGSACLRSLVLFPGLGQVRRTRSRRPSKLTQRPSQRQVRRESGTHGRPTEIRHR